MTVGPSKSSPGGMTRESRDHSSSSSSKFKNVTRYTPTPHTSSLHSS